MSHIRIIAMDCDGVLTDGRLSFSIDGGTIRKCFHFHDVMGLNMAQRLGIRIAILSGEKILAAFVKKLDIRKRYPDVTFKPIICSKVKNKRKALQELLNRYSIERNEAVFIGDDVNDLSAMKLAGFPVAVGDAVAQVKAQAKYVTQATGGGGAVREVIDYILKRDYKPQYAAFLNLLNA